LNQKETLKMAGGKKAPHRKGRRVDRDAKTQGRGEIALCKSTRALCKRRQKPQRREEGTRGKTNEQHSLPEKCKATMRASIERVLPKSAGRGTRELICSCVKAVKASPGEAFRGGKCTGVRHGRSSLDRAGAKGRRKILTRRKKMDQAKRASTKTIDE